jgi:uncharacterized protein (TIGR00661 family)
MPTSKTVLICPLDWGLGHATRMVPVIELLLNAGAKVILAADRGPLEFLRHRFASLKTVRLEGFVPQYPSKGSMAVAMIKSYPDMRKHARMAKQKLDAIIDQHNIDIVISDNRYELHSSSVYSVFITHQLQIRTSGLSRLASPFIHHEIHGYIKKYDEIWIPDFGDEPYLSGKLGHPEKMPVQHYAYIGPLSRFSFMKRHQTTDRTQLLVLLSGPEPQRTLLEDIICKQILMSGIEAIVLQGIPGKGEIKQERNITFLPHLTDDKLAALINNAEHILCRPGYSTLMDLAVLGKKASFIPTPGQTEQEYLAEYCRDKKWFPFQKQDEFNLEEALKSADNYSGVQVNADHTVLKRRLDKLLS